MISGFKFILAVFFLGILSVQAQGDSLRVIRINYVFNSVDEAKDFIALGVNINRTDLKNGWTPLLYAVQGGKYEVAKYLIEQGAKVNVHSAEERLSALSRAAAIGHLDLVKLLIKHKADINHQSKNFGSTALMHAAVNGHLQVLKYLIRHGALIDVRANRGESALLLAVSAEQVEVVKQLLKAKANRERPDVFGITPLKRAEDLNNTEIIKLLKQYKL